MTQIANQIDISCINAIRALSADAVEKAKSGHPGAPLGMAPMAYVLWTRHLRHNPADIEWENRDRFILSAGHASMLLYSLLHLTGYDISLDDLKSFRQWGSKTPGHPEYPHIPGVETTTGPLGQGFSNAVGMAMAERSVAAMFNRENFHLVNHHTYVIAGDGDLMEGISYEAASIAGHQKLGRLICLYDSNQITIDGSTDLSFSENVEQRFESMGWDVQVVSDGNHDLEGIDQAIERAKAEDQKPSLIIVRTTIGYGSPNKQNTSKSHGAPLGEEEVTLLKKELGLPTDKKFYVPDEVYESFALGIQGNSKIYDEWKNLYKEYAAKYPDLAELWKICQNRNVTRGLDQVLPKFDIDTGNIATRAASGKTLNAFANVIPNFVSGSADLSDSVNTTLEGFEQLGPEQPDARNLPFGVREHAMGAIANGIILHRGIIPVVGTFLIFSDYMKPAIRLAALMGLPALYAFSHDSVALGEDGPTHQPIEQLAGLRAIPNLRVFRPCDANETSIAWKMGVTNPEGPSAIVLTRQKVPLLTSDKDNLQDLMAKGAYVINAEDESKPIDVVLLATGSEVHLACSVKARLAEIGKNVRVVSIPCWELFEQQDDEYKEKILPRSTTKRVSIEAAATMGWHRWVGSEGMVIGLDRFGASAPSQIALENLGFNSEAVFQSIQKYLS